MPWNWARRTGSKKLHMHPGLLCAQLRTRPPTPQLTARFMKSPRLSAYSMRVSSRLRWARERVQVKIKATTCCYRTTWASQASTQHSRALTTSKTSSVGPKCLDRDPMKGTRRKRIRNAWAHQSLTPFSRILRAGMTLKATWRMMSRSHKSPRQTTSKRLDRSSGRLLTHRCRLQDLSEAYSNYSKYCKAAKTTWLTIFSDSHNWNFNFSEFISPTIITLPTQTFPKLIDKHT